MNLMEILQGQLSDDVIGQISQQIGAQPEQTASAANGIFTSLLGGLANNATQEGGLSAIAGALDRNHDGSVLDDIMGMVGTVMNGQGSGATNGLGILGHILGDNQENVAQQVSQSSGLSMGQVMKLMPVLAPIVMGVIGKMRGQDGFQLSDLPGILLGSAQSGAQQSGMGDLLGGLLGSVLGGGGQQQGGGLGNILGNILGGGR
ncbi:MAG: DUF937 domain-containing protein [Saprospiraceae bacterium]|nr:DUF937 domain-containing protein [Saprospiraceae bacterium]